MDMAILFGIVIVAAFVIAVFASRSGGRAGLDMRRLDGLERRVDRVVDRLAQLERAVQWLRSEGPVVEPPPGLRGAAEAPEEPAQARPEAVEPQTTPAETPRPHRPVYEPAELETETLPPPLHPEEAVPPRTKPALVDRFAAWLKSLGPKETMSWEMALGTFWLPRLGVAALSIAIVFLLTLALQKWGPPVRVGLGYGVAAALLGVGWRLDRKYPNYARVLFGAGFALTYFVTFATYFVPFAKLFDTPYLSLAGLAAVVVAWAALAERRDSQIIAGIAMALGQFTIALATYSLDSPAVYSIAGIVFLSVGGAFFLLRNGWYAVATVGMAASYLNHFYLMTRIEGTGTPAEFAVGMTVLATYFVVYAGAEMIAPRSLRRERIPLWFRNSFVTANSLGFLALGTLLMRGYDFAVDEQPLFRYIFAAALLAGGLVYLRARKGDPLYNTYLTKGVTVATWGLVAQFEATTLTTGLAVETLVLLFASRRSGLLVTRVLALVAGVLTLFQAAETFYAAGAIPYDAPGFAARIAEAAAVVLAFLAASLLYQRTDWSLRSPKGTWLSADANRMLWALDLISTKPAAPEDLKKPANGLLFPHAFALGAAGLFMGYTTFLAGESDRTMVIALMAVALTGAAIVLRSAPYGLASLALAVVAAVLGTADVLTFTVPSLNAVIAIAVLGAIAVCTERRYLGAREGLTFHHQPATAYGLYALTAWWTGLHLITTIATPAWDVASLAIAGLVAAGLAIPLHRKALAYCAVGFVIWAQLRWYAGWAEDAGSYFLALAWALMAAELLGERYFRRLSVDIVRPILVAAAVALYMPYIYLEYPQPWTGFLWTVGAIALTGYGAAIRQRTAAALGVGLLVAGTAYHAAYALQTDLPLAPLIAGFLTPAACWIALERGVHRLAGRFDLKLKLSPSAAPAAIGTLLLVLFFYRLPHVQEFYLTIAWSLLGMGLFGLALAFREKVYRYCGLAVLALASVRVALIDTRELETLPKVFAWGVLGVVLIALGYGYVAAFHRSRQT